MQTLTCSLLTPGLFADSLSWEDESAYQIASYSIPSLWKETKGKGIVIGVIDSGCEIDHPDLRGNVLPGKNLINPNSRPDDDNGHGTFVAGIICAKHNNEGVHGVAPESTAIPYKALNAEGSGTYDHVLAAIHAAIDDRVDIINFSIGMSHFTQDLKDAVKRTYDANIPLVCAAGNYGEKEHFDVVHPASAKETIAIGAVDVFRKRASFSNTGQNLDFMAPGVNVRSTFPGGEYRRSNGTSFAAPWICGIIALAMAKHRNLGGFTPMRTVEEVRNHLKKASIDLGDPGKDLKYGHGIIDARRVLSGLRKKAKPMPPIAPSRGFGRVTGSASTEPVDDYCSALKRRSI